MTHLIGNKNTFAIQYSLHPVGSFWMAKTCIWIQGKYFGNPEDTGLLFCVYNSLELLTKQGENFYDDKFLTMSPIQIFSAIGVADWDALTPEEQDLKIDLDKFRLNGLGENYDLFTIRAYTVNNVCHFIWKLLPSEMMTEYYKGLTHYTMEVQHATANREEIQHVLDLLWPVIVKNR
jgi:hypothetical protein